MLAEQPQHDPAMIDREWVGYHPRAAIPAIVFTSALTLSLGVGRWYLDHLSIKPAGLITWFTFALAWGIWPLVTAVFFYRTATHTYRLTDRFLLIDFGPLSRPVRPISLSEVRAVTSGASWIARRLGVGWVEVWTHEAATRLLGVRHPGRFAARIRNASGDSTPS